MRDAVYDIAKSFWTNNPYWLNGFHPRKIMLCSPDGVLPLNEHPDWVRCKGIFTPGEFANNIIFQQFNERF
jgi:hypothetical protein